LQTEQNIIF